MLMLFNLTSKSYVNVQHFDFMLNIIIPLDYTVVVIWYLTIKKGRAHFLQFISALHIYLTCALKTLL